MPINREMLRGMGIDAVRLEISTEDVNSFVTDILYRNDFSPDEARVFSLKAMGYDVRSQATAELDRTDAVLHISTEKMRLPAYLSASHCLIYIYTLYTEPPFSSCGIATEMLDQLHIKAEQVFGHMAEMELLTPVPQYKVTRVKSYRFLMGSSTTTSSNGSSLSIKNGGLILATIYVLCSDGSTDDILLY